MESLHLRIEGTESRKDVAWSRADGEIGLASVATTSMPIKKMTRKRGGAMTV
jgi:hypothetical protein